MILQIKKLRAGCGGDTCWPEVLLVSLVALRLLPSIVSKHSFRFTLLFCFGHDNSFMCVYPFVLGFNSTGLWEDGRDETLCTNVAERRRLFGSLEG